MKEQWQLFQGDNPFKGISLFPEKPRERFLSPIEASKLLKAQEQDSNTLLRDFIKLSLMTGVRKSNLASMRWEDIDFDQRTWANRRHE
ncbi:MAG: tyrosine-type recombinase/integrase, partial [Cyanobacteria bacterium]|nr:tyrosine-type recombinase/integrase [Cyanobacteriota bacterium]